MSKYCNHCMALLEKSGGACPVCGRTPSEDIPAHHLLPGTLLNNRFYVGEALGEGGFGITYIGRDTKLDMKVAIKEFYPNGYVTRINVVSSQVKDSVTEGRRDFFEKGRERFLREARVLAKFSGEPGVVDVRDFFEENNTAYIIMEYLDGVDLKTHLNKTGVLAPEATIRLLMPVMNSLKKVHAQGLIHRDISPDNIMVIGDKVKLLDFGAARTVSAAANKSLSVMLKPGYAPEEQYRSKGVQGPWTDIYALCATMYKCITGITPDDATQRVFSDEVKTPSALNIAIKPEIEKAVMRGMSVHQTDRYQSIEDLIRGLQGIEIAMVGSDQTMAPGQNVNEDEVETVYVPDDSDDKTVLGVVEVTPDNDDKTVLGVVPERTVYSSGVPVAPANITPAAPVIAESVTPVYVAPAVPVASAQPVVNRQPNQPEQRKSGALWLWLLLVAAAVALAAFLLIFAFGGDSDKDPSTQQGEDKAPTYVVGGDSTTDTTTTSKKPSKSKTTKTTKAAKTTRTSQDEDPVNTTTTTTKRPTTTTTRSTTTTTTRRTTTTTTRRTTTTTTRRTTTTTEPSIPTMPTRSTTRKTTDRVP